MRGTREGCESIVLGNSSTSIGPKGLLSKGWCPKGQGGEAKRALRQLAFSSERGSKPTGKLRSKPNGKKRSRRCATPSFLLRKGKAVKEGP